MQARNTVRNGSPEPQETIAYAELLKIAHEEGLESIATQLLPIREIRGYPYGER